MPIRSGVSSLFNTGWAQYQDTAYTTLTPFQIPDGITATLPNNSGTTITTYLPAGVDRLYDSVTQRITPAKKMYQRQHHDTLRKTQGNLIGYGQRHYG